MWKPSCPIPASHLSSFVFDSLACWASSECLSVCISTNSHILPGRWVTYTIHKIVKDFFLLHSKEESVNWNLDPQVHLFQTLFCRLLFSIEHTLLFHFLFSYTKRMLLRVICTSSSSANIFILSLQVSLLLVWILQ